MTCRPTLLRIESVPVLPQKSRAHPGKSAKSRIVKAGLRYILLNGCSPPAGKVPVHLPVECTPIFPACQRQKVVEQKPRAESGSGHNVPFPMPPAPAATPGTFRRVQGTGPSCAPPVPPALSTSPYQQRLEVACTSPGSESRSRFAEGSHAWPRVKSCGPRRRLWIPGKTGQGPENSCVVIACLTAPSRPVS